MVILGTSLDRLTVSGTSAPFVTENDVVFTNDEGDKNYSCKLEKYCENIMKCVNETRTERNVVKCISQKDLYTGCVTGNGPFWK